MLKRPKGAKYRNLTRCGGVIYYERLAHGRRIRLSCKTDSWDDAASFRDAFEAHKGIGCVPFLYEMPRLAEFAARYLAEDTAHLAPTTRGHRRGTPARWRRGPPEERPHAQGRALSPTTSGAARPL